MHVQLDAIDCAWFLKGFQAAHELEVAAAEQRETGERKGPAPHAKVDQRRTPKFPPPATRARVGTRPRGARAAARVPDLPPSLKYFDDRRK